MGTVPWSIAAKLTSETPESWCTNALLTWVRTWQIRPPQRRPPLVSPTGRPLLVEVEQFGGLSLCLDLQTGQVAALIPYPHEPVLDQTSVWLPQTGQNRSSWSSPSSPRAAVTPPNPPPISPYVSVVGLSGHGSVPFVVPCELRRSMHVGKTVEMGASVCWFTGSASPRRPRFSRSASGLPSRSASSGSTQIRARAVGTGHR